MENLLVVQENIISPEVAALLGDRMWRLNNLYKIKNDDFEVVTFKLRPAQRYLIENFHERSVVLKSRQFGFTSLMVILHLDAILFEKNIETMMICHREESAQDIFVKKALFAYDMLPDFIRELRPCLVRRNGELRISHGRKEYSSMRVGVNGRGGTLRYLHVSEFGQLSTKHPDRAKEVITGAMNAGFNQITTVESTSEGAFGQFYELCQKALDLKRSGGELTRLDFKFFFFGWHLHPLCVLDADFEITPEWRDYFSGIGVDDERRMRWYIKKTIEQGRQGMYQEYPSTPEEAFQKILDGTYYAEQMSREDLVGDYPYDPKYKVHVGCDIGHSDATVVIFFQVIDGKMFILETVHILSGDLALYMRCLNDRADRWVYGKLFAPHDIDVYEWGAGSTRADQAWQNFGIKFVVIPKVKDILNGINFVRQIFPRIFIHNEGNETLISHLRSYRKKRNERLGVWESKPYHDLSSDFADCMRYCCRGFALLESSDGMVDMDNDIEKGACL